MGSPGQSDDGRENSWKKLEVYNDKGSNVGVNTYDSDWEIGENWASDCRNIRLGIEKGFRSADGMTILNDDVSVLGAYMTNVGRCEKLFDGRIVIAQSNGINSVLFFVDPATGIYTKHTGSLTFHPTNTVNMDVGEDKLYAVDGDITHPIRYVDAGDDEVKNLTVASGGGTIPLGAKTVAFYNNRVWVSNDADGGSHTGITDADPSPNRVTASGEYEDNWWNTSTASSAGTKAWQIILDGSQADTIQAMVKGGFGTLAWIRKKSVGVLTGTNETNFDIPLLSTDEGTDSPNAVVASESMVYYLTSFGIKGLRGASNTDLDSKFGTVESITPTHTVKNIFKTHTAAELAAAIAVIHGDVLRVNIGTTTYIYDLVANKLQGALTLGNIDIDINGYVSDGVNLFGVSKNSGFIYELDYGYVSPLYRLINDMGDATDFTASDLDITLTDNATIGEFAEGTSAVKATFSGAVSNFFYIDETLNLNSFFAGKLITDYDYFSFYFHSTDASIFTSVELRFEKDVNNYFSTTYYNLDSALTELAARKVDFIKTGTLTWAQIERTSFRFVTTAAGSCTIDWLKARTDGSYDKYYTTKSHDFSMPENLKNFMEIRIFGKTLGDYPVYIDYFIDSETTPRGTIEARLDTGGAFYMIDQGTSTSIAFGLLQDTAKTFTVNSLTGFYLVDSAFNFFLITGNDIDTIYVEGIPTAGAYLIVPSRTCFYTDGGDIDSSFASFYGYSFNNIEDFGVCRDATTGRGHRGKRIKLKFYTTGPNTPFWVYNYQIVWELLKPVPNIAYTRRVIQ